MIQIVKETLKVALLAMALIAALFAAINPVLFGQWLQAIDTGRFGCVDYDCNM